MQPDTEISIKLIVVGNSAVGKTSLVTTYVKQRCDTNHFSTIGIDYYAKKLTYDGHVIGLNIWDTAGQEKFKSIVISFFRGTNAVLIVFDKSKKSSFDTVTEWLHIIYENTDVPNSRIMIVGNKADLCQDQESSDTDTRIESFLLERMGIQYIETSAVENQNVTELFETIVGKCIGDGSYMVRNRNPSSIYLSTTPEAKTSSSSSCCFRF